MYVYTYITYVFHLKSNVYLTYQYRENTFRLCMYTYFIVFEIYPTGYELKLAQKFHVDTHTWGISTLQYKSFDTTYIHSAAIGH